MLANCPMQAKLELGAAQHIISTVRKPRVRSFDLHEVLRCYNDVITRQELGPTPLRAGRFDVLLKTVPTLSSRCVAASETQRTNNELSFRVARHTQP